MASFSCASGTARSPWCIRPAPSSGVGPFAPWPPSWDCSPGSCGSRTTWREPRTDGGNAVTGPGTSKCGLPPSTARAAPSSGPRGALRAKPYSGGTPRSSTRTPPVWTPAAAASRSRGAGSWPPCGGRRRVTLPPCHSPMAGRCSLRRRPLCPLARPPSESAPLPRPTGTWHQQVECQRVWARASPSMRGGPLGGRICLAGMPWRTKIPTPLGWSIPNPPPPRDSKGAP